MFITSEDGHKDCNLSPKSYLTKMLIMMWSPNIKVEKNWLSIFYFNSFIPDFIIKWHT